jgi:mRNA interferase MazF
MTTPQIKRGEIWWVRLDPTQGSEIKKTRPCVVLTDNTLNELRKTVVVVPLSSVAKPHPPITVSILCQDKSAVAVIDQIRSVAKHRLISKIETASKTDIQKITEAISSILQIVL